MQLLAMLAHSIVRSIIQGGICGVADICGVAPTVLLCNDMTELVVLVLNTDVTALVLPGTDVVQLAAIR